MHITSLSGIFTASPVEPQSSLRFSSLPFEGWWQTAPCIIVVADSSTYSCGGRQLQVWLWWQTASRIVVMRWSQGTVEDKLWWPTLVKSQQVVTLRTEQQTAYRLHHQIPRSRLLTHLSSRKYCTPVHHRSIWKRSWSVHSTRTAPRDTVYKVCRNCSRNKN